MENAAQKVQAKDAEMTPRRKAVVEKMLRLRSKGRDISARIMKEVDDEYKRTMPTFIKASGSVTVLAKPSGVMLSTNKK